MTFLPIVARELRVASRRRATYWSRFVMALATIVVGLFVFVDARSSPPHEQGGELFGVLSILAFIYCLGAGIRSTADCLSEEKRDGTLGLLFLTDLKGYDVVIGKLVATSLNSFFGLLAIFPVLAIPLLMGGITNGEFWRLALLLANVFLFSLAIGMFISSISQYPRRAVAASTVLILVISVGLPIFQDWLSSHHKHPLLDLVIRNIVPETAYMLIGDMEYAKGMKDFWWSVGTIHGLCWVLLAVASFIVPRSWQDKPPGAKIARWRELWHSWSFGDAADRQAFRKRLLDINAFFWLAGRARLKPAHVWAAFAVAGCLWAWGWVEFRREWLNIGVYILTALVLSTMLKIWVASEAGRRLGEDRKMGALELLLSTPLTVRDILRGQFLALKRQFFGPLMFVLILEAVLMLASLKGNHNSGEPAMIVSGGLVVMVMLVADLLAVSALAMWTSLTAKNPNRTTGMTIRRILVLPWAVIVGGSIACSLLSAILDILRPLGDFLNRGDNGWKSFLVVYFVIGMATDLWFGLNAWRRLRTEFREVAVERVVASPSIWSRLWRRRTEPTPGTPPVIAS
jgi:ABC-type transport system involved in cytochrome c biogenesis permease component